MRRSTFALALSCLVGVILLGLPSNQPRAAEDVASEFSGKFLQVSSKDRDAGGYITGAEIREIRGRSFLVGKVAAPNSYWKPYDGRLVYIDWETVHGIIVFDSFEEMKESQN